MSEERSLTESTSKAVGVSDLKKRTALVPTNLKEAQELAQSMANSDIVPPDFKRKPDNVLIAIGMGMEVGLSPMQAIQNIYIVNGRPSMFGDAVLGLIQNSGLLDDFEESYDPAAQTATCRSRRKGTTRDVIRTFSIDDAKKAGLWGKQGPWSNYPRRMLQMRARSWNLRDNFADVIKGLNFREEMEDVPPNAIEAEVTMPKRVSATTEAPATIAADTAEVPASQKMIDDTMRKELFALLKQRQVQKDVFQNFLKQKFGYESTDKITMEDHAQIVEWVRDPYSF